MPSFHKKEALSYSKINPKETEAGLLQKKSSYRLPFSLLPLRASNSKIIDYLKENCGLQSCDFVSTRNDLLPMVSVTTIWEDACTGHGASLYDHKTALSKAIGEGLERYLLSHPKLSKASLRDKKYSEMPHLESFPSFLKEQITFYPSFFSKKDKDVVFETVECKSLFSHTKKNIPAQYIFWKYKNKNEPKLVPQTTNGAGAHFTYEEAILSGLHEEIQRDTFLFYWLLKKTPQKIDPSTVRGSVSKEIIENLKSKGIEVHILVLENDYKIPVFLSLLIDRRVEPILLSLGAGTNIVSCEGAIEAALYESVGVLGMTAGYTKKRYKIDSSYKPFFDPALTRLERITLWAGTWGVENIAFFISGEILPLTQFKSKDLPPNDPKKILTTLKDNLRIGGISEIFVYEVLSPHLSRINYHVVKVVVPEFLQLHLLENQATLSSYRLAQTLKKQQSSLSLQDFNPLPHLFP